MFNKIKNRFLEVALSLGFISIPTFMLIAFASTIPVRNIGNIVATASNAENITIATVSVATPSEVAIDNRSFIEKAVSSKVIKNSWIKEDNNYYYFGNDAKIYKGGIFTINGNRYYFDEEGILVTGRFAYANTEFWSSDDGPLLSSTWVDNNDTWYYINENGSIFKNGTTPDGYDVDENGCYVIDEDDIISKYSEFSYSNPNSKKDLRLNVGTGDIIWSFLKENGWTDTAIAGAMGNFQQESQMSPTLKEKGGTGYGLAQWSFGRKTAMLNWCSANGYSDKSLEAQLKYLLIEPGESSYVNSYSKTNFASAAEAAIAWCKNWERPNMSKAHLSDVRIPYAEAYYAHYVNGENFAVSSYVYVEPEMDKENIEEETIATDSDATEISIDDRTDENYGPAFIIHETEEETSEVGPGIEKQTETESLLETTEETISETN